MVLTLISKNMYLIKRAEIRTKVLFDLFYGIKIKVKAILLKTLLYMLIASYSYVTHYGWQYYAGAMLCVIIGSLMPYIAYAILSGIIFGIANLLLLKEG